MVFEVFFWLNGDIGLVAAFSQFVSTLFFLPLLEFEGLAINSRGIKDASRHQTLVRDIQRVATYIVSVIV